jgi:hypothetical protein
MIDESISLLTPIIGTKPTLAVVGADRATGIATFAPSTTPQRPERVTTPQHRDVAPTLPFFPEVAWINQPPEEATDSLNR